MIRQSLTLGWLASCNALLTVLVPWYVVTRLSVGVETDAFFAAGALPQLISVVVSTSLAQVLVPLLATEDEKSFRKDAWGFFLGISGLFALIGFALLVTAGYWVPLLVPGFSVEGKMLATTLTRIQLVSMALAASVIILWSVYQSRQKFVWAEVASLLANGASLLVLIWALPSYGIVAAAWATVLNNGLKLFLLLPILGRWQRPDWGSQTIREAWRRIKPFLLGQTYYKTDPLVDRFLTSMTFAGSLSMLYIGQQVYATINQVINKAISSPMVPLLAIAAKAGDWSAYRLIYRKRLLWIAAVTSCGYLVLLLFGESLLHLTIGHGGIEEENVRTLWWTMIVLGGVLVGGALGQTTSVAFYAMGDTKTPTRMLIWTYTLYLPLKVVVFFRSGLIGLAIMTSIFIVLNFALQLIVLEKKTQRRPDQVASYLSGALKAEEI